jgi:acyl-CoA reductase-like NAD-dependent aldehyde dehydrogenase
MIIDHTNCSHNTDPQSRALCRAKRAEIRDEIAKVIEHYGLALSAWNGLSPRSVAEFMMSSADAMSQFQKSNALQAVNGA